MTRQKTICPDCVGLMLHRLPVSRGFRAFTTGALGFVAAFFAERPEKCDECGLLRPYCFHYPMPVDDEPCVHCGVHEEHHANAGHKFRARAASDVGVAINDDCAHGVHAWADIPGSMTSVKCTRCDALSLRVHVFNGACGQGVHSWVWEPTGHVNDGYLRCTTCRIYANSEQIASWKEEDHAQRPDET